MADITVIQGQMGAAEEANTAAGQSHGIRLSRAAGVLTSDIAARFQAAVLRGRCYGVANQSGVTSQAGLSLTTPVLSLYNPAGSGVNGILWYAGANFAVVNAAAAAVWLAVNTNVAAAATTGTATTTHRNLLLGGAAGNKIQPLLAATLPAAPVGLCLLGMGLTGAITVETVGKTVGGWMDGCIIIGPGTTVSIQTSTASGASGLWCDFKWEEVAV